MKRKRLRKVYDKKTYRTIVDGIKTSEEANEIINKLYAANPNINYKKDVYFIS